MNPPAHDPNCLLMVQLPFTSAGISHGTCPVLPALGQAAHTNTLCVARSRGRWLHSKGGTWNDEGPQRSCHSGPPAMGRDVMH